MPLWGKNDTAVTANSSTTKESSSGAPMGTWARVKGSGRGTNPVPMSANAKYGNTSPGSAASVDYNLYGNTTVGAFINNIAVGVFAVNTTMLQTSGGGIELGYITNGGGTGYQANAAVTLTVTNGGSGATANAFANTTPGASAGRITALNAQVSGNNYITPPTPTIAAPAAINITANTTGVVNNALLITSASSYWQVGDQLTYGVPAGNTAIPGLTGNSTYYVALSNTTGIQLSSTVGGAVITLTPITTAGQTHTVQGVTATGYFDVASAFPQVTHAGWVLRKEGTGGRAGRVTYETLVAMSSIGQGTITSNTVDNIV